jgi:UDP-sugar diphosphatase
VIKNVTVKKCDEHRFVEVECMHYEQDGVQKRWEIAKVFDSVSILLYHQAKEAFTLVKQFRPAIYLNNDDGYTYELCAGIVDKDKSLEQIAQEEILEECGYDVALASIEKVTSFYTAVGFAGAKQTLFFATIDENMRVNDGGGIDDEMIEVIHLPIAEAKSFMYDESVVKTPGLMFAFSWYFTKENN